MAAEQVMSVAANNNGLVITWQNMPRARHDEIVETLRAIKHASFDRKTSCWTVPAKQADRIYAEFPHASYSYDAICMIVVAQERRNRILYQNLRAMELELSVEDGRVVASGATATPVLQKFLDDRPDFAEYVLAQPAPPPVNQTPSPVARDAEHMRQAELFSLSLRNAATHQYRAERFAAQRRKTPRGR